MPPPRKRWFAALCGIGLVGLAVRVTYTASFRRHGGDGGDAFYYHHAANLLAGGRGFIHPYEWVVYGRLAPGAEHPPAYIVALAVPSALGLKTFFAHQLFSCLIGAVTVIVTGLAAREVAGPRAGLIAAGITAVYPFFWLNDAQVLSETFVQLTTALFLLAAYRCWHRPGMATAVVLGLVCALNALTRAETALYVPLAVVALILLARSRSVRQRLMALALTGGVTLVAIAPWCVYNLSRFDRTTTLSTGFGPTFATANCDVTYYGKLQGYWSQECLKDIPIDATSDTSVKGAAYTRGALDYISSHHSRVPVVVVSRLGRAFSFYRPLQQVNLDAFIEQRNLRAGQVGLAMYYGLVAAAVGGTVVLRRRRLPLSPMVAVVGTVAVAAAMTFGQTRYRAPVEVVVTVLAAVALDAWWARWQAARRRPEPAHDAVDALGLREPEPVGASGEAGPVPVGPLSSLVGFVRGGPERHTPFPCLDGLRAIAALGVLLVHTAFDSGLTNARPGVGHFTARFEAGVAVFFVLSGFLLYRPFVLAHFRDEAGPAVRPYLRRRLLRLVPAYWVALTLSAYVLNTVERPQSALDTVLVYGFGQVYRKSSYFNGLSQAWSLCTEMSFYLFLPLFAAGVVAATRGWARRDRLRAQVIALVGLVVVALLFKQWTATGFPGGIYGAWLPANLDLFAAGMALAVASAWIQTTGWRPGWTDHPHLPLASWALAAVAFWAAAIPAGLSLSPLTVLSASQFQARQLLYLLVAFFLVAPGVFGPQHQGVIRRALRSPVAVLVGLVSYGIFLWHQTVIGLLFRWRHAPTFGISFTKLTAATFVLSLLVAVASFVLVERPFLRLKERPGRPPVRVEPARPVEVR